MKEINLYVRGRADYMKEEKIGGWIAVLEYGSRCKVLKGKDRNVTSNAMIITGIMESIKVLKEPCVINLYTHTCVGFKTKKSPNQTLMNKLKDQITIGQHQLKEIISQDRQKELAKMMKSMFE